MAAALLSTTVAAQSPVTRACSATTAANTLIDAAKGAGKEPDRPQLNAALLIEAQEILKLDSWTVVAGEGAL